ncbi:DUF3093 domain-containing protein [Leucobacter weissii]|uniref:DUF3093 domain-containing protein n=1 Tax=Leucobacter weissii TaxID=1983706 RepID=A0A939MJ34_9MICO|nr:DUF3093 domain-containing protein [Leucobacter weissii]MBO1901874.1 DUF3093 domain-containing protein [Leucobacter weissii]
MTAIPAAARYRERLSPGPWMFIALLLLVPAVMLVVTPLNPALAVPIGVMAYAAVAGSLVLFAPVVRVEHGELTAGAARIPITVLGEAEALGRDGLREAIGPGLDARSYLLVRGYIHRAVRIDVRDPADPAPCWIITTRRPDELIAAIDAARSG